MKWTIYQVCGHGEQLEHTRLLRPAEVMERFATQHSVRTASSFLPKQQALCLALSPCREQIQVRGAAVREPSPR